MKTIILSTAFLAFSTIAFAQQSKPLMKQQKMEMNKEDQMNKLKTELNLTDAQVTKIKEVKERRKAEKIDQMKMRQAEMKLKIQKNDDEMKQILTAEQYTKWQEMKNKRMAERQQKRMPQISETK